MEIENIKLLVSEFLEKLMIETQDFEVIQEGENIYFIKI